MLIFKSRSWSWKLGGSCEASWISISRPGLLPGPGSTNTMPAPSGTKWRATHRWRRCLMSGSGPILERRCSGRGYGMPVSEEACDQRITRCCSTATTAHSTAQAMAVATSSCMHLSAPVNVTKGESSRSLVRPSRHTCVIQNTFFYPTGMLGRPAACPGYHWNLGRRWSTLHHSLSFSTTSSRQSQVGHLA